jgi:hypothetical protein
VWGCYLSPVANAYGKPGLAPAADRLAMCRAAVADSDKVMVSGWEAGQAGYTRTYQVRPEHCWVCISVCLFTSMCICGLVGFCFVVVSW